MEDVINNETTHSSDKYISEHFYHKNPWEYESTHLERREYFDKRNDGRIMWYYHYHGMGGSRSLPFSPNILRVQQRACSISILTICPDLLH